MSSGRRGGKSFVVALIAVFIACFRDFRPYLSPGERGVVMCLAADRRQAKVIFGYCRALIVGVPMLRKMLVRETAEELELNNQVSIEVHTSSFRAVRGPTVVAALCDEVAFWRSEDTVNPDVEVLNAIRPSMATIPGALLIGLSSPYARRGVLWEAHRDHYGENDDGVLVWQADTATMNPTISAKVIEREYARDPISAASEYGSAFRSDISTFLDVELLDTLTRSEPREIPPQGKRYIAFTDPSGGRGDSFTLAIGHVEKEICVIDLTRAVRPPFDPHVVVKEFSELLKSYGIHEVTGDHYAAEWNVSAFNDAGIRYKNASIPKSQIYLEALPGFTQGKIELPPDVRLLTELAQLERRTSRSGKDSVDHPPRAHDDIANAVRGVLWLCQDASSQVPWGMSNAELGISYPD